ncbi:MAG: SbcC/MukB-like Walker B domain-containing protein, partial [Nitrospira sp.]
FQMLAAAYTQIPVLILESSIPLLEEEANRILGKISSSGLRVTLETQKALKSRDGLAETLDINVRDVFGERMLECFSGGERARVDLAIRIGLSRLLANRAGARLETLVVDEAFAAVDREGVEQLVECLPMLTEEFPVILFITHDESFKSSIAQQILVSKDGSGSVVEIIA